MFSNKTVVVLLLLLILSIAGNLWQAGMRHPLAPASGTGISQAGPWKQAQSRTLRVSTYNIHRGKGTDGIRDLGRAASILETADVAGLNEVGGALIRGRPSQVESIGAQISAGWLFAPNQTRWYRDYFGNGLLSRYPVHAWNIQPLVHDPRSGHSLRNLIIAQIRFHEVTIRFLVTHLDLGPIQSEQLESVIYDFTQGEPAVLLGDLNTREHNPLLQALFSTTDAVDAIRAALPDTDHSDRIDWIISRGFRILGGGRTPPGISDHPNYWVDLELPPAEAPDQGSARPDQTPRHSDPAHETPAAQATHR